MTEKRRREDESTITKRFRKIALDSVGIQNVYNPELNFDQNPHYYYQNRVLYYLHQHRLSDFKNNVIENK
jgi:hypothetical protein